MLGRGERFPATVVNRPTLNVGFPLTSIEAARHDASCVTKIDIQILNILGQSVVTAVTDVFTNDTEDLLG